MRFLKREDFGECIRPAQFCMQHRLKGFRRYTAGTIVIDEIEYSWWAYFSEQYCLAFPVEEINHVLLFEMDYKQSLPLTTPYSNKHYKLTDFNSAKKAPPIMQRF